MRKICRLLGPAILTLAAFSIMSARTASARAAHPPNSPELPSMQIVATPTPTPEADEGDDQDNETEGKSETVWQTIIQTIVFPFEKLAEGVRNALAELFSRTVEAAMEPMKKALDMAVAWLYPQDMLKDIRWKAWGAMAKVAAALMPLALMITAGSAMREGVTSITGYANAREALLNWLIGVGAAAASYFLIEKATFPVHLRARSATRWVRPSLRSGIWVTSSLEASSISGHCRALDH